MENSLVILDVARTNQEEAVALIVKPPQKTQQLKKTYDLCYNNNSKYLKSMLLPRSRKKTAGTPYD